MKLTRSSELLTVELESTRLRLDLLQKQLLIVSRPQHGRRDAEAADAPAAVTGGGGGGGSSSRKRLLPLLWQEGASEASISHPDDRLELAQRGGRRAAGGGSPPRPAGGVGTTVIAPDGSTVLAAQRAVALRDDAACRPLVIVKLPAVAAKAARLPPLEQALPLKVVSNERELVAASVQRSVEEEQGVLRIKEVLRQRDADAQELRYYSLLTTHNVLPTTYNGLRYTRYSLLYSLLTDHDSLRSTYEPLLTTLY